MVYSVVLGEEGGANPDFTAFSTYSQISETAEITLFNPVFLN